VQKHISAFFVSLLRNARCNTLPPPDQIVSENVKAALVGPAEAALPDGGSPTEHTTSKAAQEEELRVLLFLTCGNLCFLLTRSSRCMAKRGWWAPRKRPSRWRSAWARRASGCIMHSWTCICGRGCTRRPRPGTRRWRRRGLRRTRPRAGRSWSG
jgi:hypothetical protein